MNTSIFLDRTDIQILTGKSRRTAERHYRNLQDAIGKQIHQKLTLTDYANYMAVPIAELKKALNRV